MTDKNPNDSLITFGNIQLDVEANQIINGEQCIQVEPKLVDVLSYLYQNSDKVISREQLISEVWKGQVISDNAISRSISQLRKILSSCGSSAPTIETIPRVGYRLRLAEDVINDLGPIRTSTNKGNNKSKKNKGFDLAGVKVILFIAFTLFIAYSYLVDKFSPEPALLDYEQVILTHTPGIEKLAKFSPDNQMVSFVHSDKNTGEEFIFLHELSTNKVTKITQLPATILKYAWSPDSSQLIYSYWKDIHDRQCGINLIRFNDNKQVVSNNKILSCSDRSVVYLAWNEKADKIYLTARKSFDRPYAVYTYSFLSKRHTQLTLPPQSGNFRGDYFIAGNLDGSRIAVARYLGTSKLNLSIYDTSNDQILASHDMPSDFNSASWLGLQQSLLLGSKNKLVKYNYLTNTLVDYYPIDKNARGHAVDINGRNILYIRSNIDTNLFSYQLDTLTKIEKLVDDTSQEIMPSYANHSESLAYLSDRTGKLQIWLRDENGNNRNVSNSPASIGITPLKWSPSDQYILFQHEDEIYTLDVQKQKVKRIIDSSHKAYVANWSNTGDAVFYSSEKSGEWQIWKYQFTTDTHTQITTAGGYSANQNTNGDLYVSKIHQAGIWKLSVAHDSKTGFSKAVKLFDKFDGTNWISWQIENNKIYYFSVEQEDKGLFSFDISNQQRQLVFPFDETNLRYFSVKNNRLVLTEIENLESSIEMLREK